jgi:hypothetical protein
LRFSLAVALPLAAQTQFLPVKDIRAGMRGVGRTIFQGDRIEEFQVEILGVLENSGPRESVILARLSGGPLAESGVQQGMSGSPVYIDGKLIGAVATGFPFSKEAVAGIRPIEEMLRAPAPAPRQAMRWSPDGSQLLAGLSQPASLPFGESALKNIATPVAFTGFPASVIEHFAPQLRALGLEPRQGVSGGGAADLTPGDPGRVQPGSMISVQLMRGDLTIGADGTVTHVDGNRIYAFGHRFLAVGEVEMPFARSEVLTVLPSLNTSFKISSAKEFMGSLTTDYNFGVGGELGRLPAMLPVRVSVNGGTPYEMQIVRDPLLSPFLVQVATLSALEATERATGAATVTVRGNIEFANGTPPVQIDNVYAVDSGAAAAASLGGAVPLSYLLQTGFGELVPQQITLDVRASEIKREFVVDDLWASQSKVRPGETVEFVVALRGEAGEELIRRIPYRVAPGETAGKLQITVADALTVNLSDFAQSLAKPPPTAIGAVEFLNGLRPNHQAYLRVLRPQATFAIGQQQLPDPPPSVTLLLNRWVSPSSRPLALSRIAEFPIDGGGAAVSGSRTIQIDVIE